jgi:hypothetical protein
MKISYSVMGRFGNNLFQYFATKILQNKLLSCNRIYNFEYNTKFDNVYIVNDDNYLDILNDIIKIPNNTNIYLDGYFQFDKHIRENKDYVNTLLNITNTEKINDHYDISIIANKMFHFKREFTHDEVVIHIRLDDFLSANVCMNYMQYINIINTFPSHIKKIIIVTDKLRQQWELQYINLIHIFSNNKNLIVQIESGDDLIQDFCKMYYSKNFFSSNSTFSYLAGLLGNHILSWCPNNKVRYPHQSVEIFNNNTFSFDSEYLPYP